MLTSGARDAQGRLAVNMFVSHAAPGIEFDEDNHAVVREILKRCAGLPIAIAVSGAAVALGMSSGLEFGFACRTYFNPLDKEMHLGASLLDSAINLSLNSIEEMFAEGGGFKYPFKPYFEYVWDISSDREEKTNKYTLREMYISLCVLKNQEFAPVGALVGMWKIGESNAMDVCMRFSSLSLAKLASAKSSLYGSGL